jgi:hypothetical protein
VIARALLVLAIAAAATAADVGVDEPSRWWDPLASHHGLHGLGGAAIGCATFAAVAPHAGRAASYGSAIAAAAVCGIGWELLAAHHGADLVDPVDAAWVVAFAPVGAAIADATGLRITVLPRRDGAALAIACDL